MRKIHYKKENHFRLIQYLSEQVGPTAAAQAQAPPAAIGIQVLATVGAPHLLELLLAVVRFFKSLDQRH